MKKLPRWLRIIIYSLVGIILLIAFIFVVVGILTKASNERDWNKDQEVLPRAQINGNIVSIYNIRNFSYTSTSSYTSNYYDKQFDLNKIVKVWYVVEPFSGIPGSAHTFLSFEFEENKFVSISVEIRKEKGESFHPLKGLFNQYELMYVIADERDAIKLRSNYRKDLVYLYPIKTTKKQAQELFTGMIDRTNNLADHPEFYNSITNTCTTNIAKHVNNIIAGKVPLFNLRILLPANSDKLAYKLGLIDTDLSFEEARKEYLINDRAVKYGSDPNFSLRIRNR